MLSVLRKRLLLRGFIVSDFAAKQADFLRDVGEWVRAGRLKYREDIVNGLENAPASFLGLLRGNNFGKMLVKVGDVNMKARFPHPRGRISVPPHKRAKWRDQAAVATGRGCHEP